jgi:hypothetical protein
VCWSPCSAVCTHPLTSPRECQSSSTSATLRLLSSQAVSLLVASAHRVHAGRGHVKAGRAWCMEKWGRRAGSLTRRAASRPDMLRDSPACALISSCSRLTQPQFERPFKLEQDSRLSAGRILRCVLLDELLVVGHRCREHAHRSRHDHAPSFCASVRRPCCLRSLSGRLQRGADEILQSLLPVGESKRAKRRWLEELFSVAK